MGLGEIIHNRRIRKIYILILIVVFIFKLVSSLYLDFHTDKIGGYSQNGEITNGHYFVLTHDSKLVEISAFDWYLNAVLFDLSFFLSIIWGGGGVFLLIVFFILPKMQIDWTKRYKKSKKWICEKCGTNNSGQFSHCYKCKHEKNES